MAVLYSFELIDSLGYLFQGDFQWCSAGGDTVVLAETTLSVLSNPERRTLQRLALVKLQTLSINCTIPTSKGMIFMRLLA